MKLLFGKRNLCVRVCTYIYVCMYTHTFAVFSLLCIVSLNFLQCVYIYSSETDKYLHFEDNDEIVLSYAFAEIYCHLYLDFIFFP